MSTVIWATQDEQHEAWLREVVGATCPECGSPVGRCYFICSHSAHYYSPEQEREDTLWNDSLSHDEWFRLAVIQYDQVYGEGAYCS